jgi:hypothetical protein
MYSACSRANLLLWDVRLQSRLTWALPDHAAPLWDGDRPTWTDAVSLVWASSFEPWLYAAGLHDRGTEGCRTGCGG